MFIYYYLVIESIDLNINSPTGVIETSRGISHCIESGKITQIFKFSQYLCSRNL